MIRKKGKSEEGKMVLTKIKNDLGIEIDNYEFFADEIKLSQKGAFEIS